MAEDTTPAVTAPAVTTPATTNAPAFTDLSAAREITRLSGLLDQANKDKSDLQIRVQALEGQVDEKKTQELEQRLNALEKENGELKTERDTLQAAQTRAELLGTLAGKVRDPEAALALLTEDLRTKDGKPDVEAIITKYPYLAPEGVTAATAPNGAGGVQVPAVTNLDKAVESKDVTAINTAFNAELKGASQ